MEKQKEVKFSINVYAYGVKKRCRKAERHQLKLGYIDYNDGTFNRDEIVAKARAIVETNMKTCQKISVQMLRVELTKDEWGTSQSFMMFDDRHVSFDVDTALNEALN